VSAVGFSSVEDRASKVQTFWLQLVVKLAPGRLLGGTWTVTFTSTVGLVVSPWLSTPRTRTVYWPAGSTGVVYE
jgi:hypothetical protein